MRLTYGQHIRCERCHRPIEDAFATLNQDAEDHWCDACVDFRGGYVPAEAQGMWLDSFCLRRYR